MFFVVEAFQTTEKLLEISYVVHRRNHDPTLTRTGMSPQLFSSSVVEIKQTDVANYLTLYFCFHRFNKSRQGVN